MAHNVDTSVGLKWAIAAERARYDEVIDIALKVLIGGIVFGILGTSLISVATGGFHHFPPQFDSACASIYGISGGTIVAALITVAIASCLKPSLPPEESV